MCACMHNVCLLKGQRMSPAHFNISHSLLYIICATSDASYNVMHFTSMPCIRDCPTTVDQTMCLFACYSISKFAMQFVNI